MSIEIEKKYRLTEGERDGIIAGLADLNAEFVGHEFEENTIFSGGALADSGGVIRIRRVGDRALLTYKRRLDSGFDVKKQIEYEVDVSDADETALILNKLGLEPKLVYEKYRDTWKLRSVEVVLDELPFGSFMEIEGSITAIREAEILLELDDVTPEPETYPRLTARLGSEVDGVIVARFPH